MRCNTLFLVPVILGCLYSSATAQTVTADDYARAESRLVYRTAPLVDRGAVQANWLPDENFWYRVLVPGGVEYVLINAKDGSRRVSPAADAFATRGKPVLYGRRSGPTVASPDGKRVVFIRDWNLWMRDSVSRKETQLTTDGIKDFGYATDNAGWRKSERPIVLWSPDSRKLATYRQDQRHVSDMYLVTTKVGAPKLQAWKYPIPEDEEVIKLHRVIIDVDAGTVVPLNIPPDPRRGTLCDDISCSGAFDDNEWSPDGSKLAFVSSSRDHKVARLRVADAATGIVTEVMEEAVQTQYESGRGAINWRYLPGSREFIWYSERSDWGHLYLYDDNGRLKNQITTGNFVVNRVLLVDAKNRIIYFEGQGREQGRDPYFSHFYSVDFAGKNIKLLTPEVGAHRIQLSPGGHYFVDTYSSPDTPPTSVLRSIRGKLIATLEQADISRLRQTGWKPPVPFTVKSRDGRWDLYGLMYVPSNLDDTQKYPVVNYIYPGPQGGSVGSREFSPSRIDCQALAELGFVVVQLDGTCNPGRSKSFHDVCYGNLADNTLEDQIAGMKQLAERFPYMDLGRVGIWGHSGGGFATAAALFNYPDFFKVGIAESGNHDSRNYEDDWAERYNGLIRHGENGSSNYEEQANQLRAKNLKGKLMLVHGGLDDNVPPYNTYLVVEALERANKDFDLIIFPNARHGFGKDIYYMMRRRWDYFVRYLKGAEPPKEFELKPVEDKRLRRP